MAPALVSVAGATSRAGKTALVEACLASLPPGRATAVKFTTTEDVFECCPRGTPCTVCDLDRPWKWVEEPEVLRQPGTDTERLSRAGARRVVWAIARRSAAAEAWAEVAGGLEGLVVMEGSSVVAHARPALLLFAVHARLDPARWKPGSEELMRCADAVVVNRSAGAGGEPTPAVLEAVGRARRAADVRVADLRQPLAAWAPDLAERLRALYAAAGPGSDRPLPAGARLGRSA